MGIEQLKELSLSLIAEILLFRYEFNGVRITLKNLYSVEKIERDNTVILTFEGGNAKLSLDKLRYNKEGAVLYVENSVEEN